MFRHGSNYKSVGRNTSPGLCMEGEDITHCVFSLLKYMVDWLRFFSSMGSCVSDIKISRFQ